MNGKPRICLVGAGRAGMIHAVNFRSRIQNADLTAVVDPVEDAAKAACKTLEIDKYYLDYKQAVEDEDIDAFVVVSPTKYHRDIVVACAQAGKHILCEKPMGITESECDDMIAAAQQNNVKLQIGFMRRHDGSFMQAKLAVDNGEIGEVVMIKSLSHGPSKPHEWMLDIEKSNGVLAEIGSHDIDTVRWFAGSELKSLYAVAGNYKNKDIADKYPDYYDTVLMTGTFENGVQASVDAASYSQYGYDARVEILGTEGIIHIGKKDAYNMQIIKKDKSINSTFIDSWRTLFKDAYLREDEHFIDCVLNDKEPQVTGLDGKMAVKIVKAGNESIKQKQIVKP
ncbi:MAG: Gfo/Idh/MocA family oxidoreductase [Clostridia bacterium]|jgi:myo-inositol 2-dehydrogenase / D-chiro-inositol 1-dehydrogenase|nr:Gfo/Idh/MocA family oxidoreductase [Clostridia bacterium]MBT7123369.1 Gfo/Idh/MocA family oxidoreductase [Clostridia bacterium]